MPFLPSFTDFQWSFWMCFLTHVNPDFSLGDRSLPKQPSRLWAHHAMRVFPRSPSSNPRMSRANHQAIPLRHSSHWTSPWSETFRQKFLDFLPVQAKLMMKVMEVWLSLCLQRRLIRKPRNLRQMCFKCGISSQFTKETQGIIRYHKWIIRQSSKSLKWEKVNPWPSNSAMMCLRSHHCEGHPHDLIARTEQHQSLWPPAEMPTPVKPFARTATKPAPKGLQKGLQKGLPGLQTSERKAYATCCAFTVRLLLVAWWLHNSLGQFLLNTNDHMIWVSEGTASDPTRRTPADGSRSLPAPLVPSTNSVTQSPNVEVFLQQLVLLLCNLVVECRMSNLVWNQQHLPAWQSQNVLHFTSRPCLELVMDLVNVPL